MTELEEEANWRNYRMPSMDWDDSLPFDGYTKKLEIKLDDTKDCRMLFIIVYSNCSNW